MALSVDQIIPYQIAHIIQLVIANDFVFEDRGQDQNMELYSQIQPPKIPLERVAHKKIVLIQGDKDQSSDREDMNRLKSVIKCNWILLINNSYI